MNRDEALRLVDRHIDNENLKKHMLATEAVMRGIAPQLDGDVELWGLAGLVHDVDLGQTADHPEDHGILGAQMLRELGVDESVCAAVERHPGFADRRPETKIEVALRAADQVTGLITAAALIHPSRSIEPLKISSLKKRMKEKRFAAGVDRAAILLCETLNIPLEEFLALAKASMNEIAAALDLDGSAAAR